MEHIRIDWNALQDEEEVEIIRRYTKSARRYMYAFVGRIPESKDTSLAYPATVVYISIPFWPGILDIVAPLNESRMRYLPFLVEYFLDEQKYFYPILLHTIVTILLGTTTVIATETLTFAFIYHICGMFEIVSYRITCILDKSILILLALNTEDTIRVKLINTVETHQRSIKYDSQWYLAPVQMQKLLLFVMQRSMKSCKLVMGDLYCVSLENFTTVTCVMDMIVNLTSSLLQNNKFIFSACESVSILLHSNLFCATMKLV
ncbi:PREDICTED: uncharacterized protein LOC105459881 [Wasmannia auropunctata]|uniref:uncharacterized protein LOC105459881 n=1 Tax=Wasmannia auropunctata TaxID=64793 RepID=UPI0005EDB1A5|nr:PREDICTED: uncharacterized protein LOC105459881 [Wasmannia auropunctata]